MVDTGLGAFKSPFMQICVKGSNIVASDCKIMLVGQMTDGTAAPDVPVRVVSLDQAAIDFGQNSVLYEMVKTAYCACSSGLYATPLTGVGAAAEYTLPITGPATENDTITLSAMGYDFAAIALIGDSAADIAQAIADAVNADAGFGYTASVSGDSVIFTADNLGEIGNQLALSIDAGDTGLLIGPELLTTAGAGAPDPSAAIAAWGECCYDCISYQGQDQIGVDALVDYSESTWGCGPEQCFSRTFYGYVDSVAGQVIYLDGRNERAEAVLPVPEGYKYASYQLAASAAARACCACCADAGRPVQFDNGLLSCLTDDTDCLTGTIWASSEKEALAQLGATIWDVNSGGNLWIERYQTTWKRDGFGNNDVTWTDGETRCAVKDFVTKWRAYNESNFSSVKLFADGTKLPFGSKATTPRIYQNEAIAFVKAEVGLTLDDADFASLIQVQANPNDANRIDVCLSLPFVNQLKNIASCINVDVTNSFVN